VVNAADPASSFGATGSRVRGHADHPAALGSDRYLALLDELRVAVDHPPVQDGDVRLERVAAREFKKLRGDVAALGPEPTDNALNRVRIRGKRALCGGTGGAGGREAREALRQGCQKVPGRDGRASGRDRRAADSSVRRGRGRRFRGRAACRTGARATRASPRGGPRCMEATLCFISRVAFLGNDEREAREGHLERRDRARNCCVTGRNERAVPAGGAERVRAAGGRWRF
jgi:hypothetical protein